MSAFSPCFSKVRSRPGFIRDVQRDWFVERIAQHLGHAVTGVADAKAQSSAMVRPATVSSLIRELRQQPTATFVQNLDRRGFAAARPGQTAG